MKRLKYEIVISELNRGTDEQPNIERVISPVVKECADEDFEDCYEAAKSRAVGKITVEDIPESPAEQIAKLKAELESTDYKIIKCSEAQLVGEDLPYDIVALHAERQALRDRINELETTGGVYDA